MLAKLKPSPKALLIIGAGGHARVVAETATLVGNYEILGFADENLSNKGRSIGKWNVLGDWRGIEADAYIVAIGKNDNRQRIFEQLIALGKNCPALIHPFSSLSPGAEIGNGTVILAGAIVQTGARIGNNVILNAGSVIDHDATVADHAHVGINAVVRGFANVGKSELLLPGQIRERTPAT